MTTTRDRLVDPPLVTPPADLIASLVRAFNEMERLATRQCCLDGHQYVAQTRDSQMATCKRCGGMVFLLHNDA
jgi:hypothetical protein